MAALREVIENTGRGRRSHTKDRVYNVPSDVPSLDKIVQLDRATSTVWVEPNVSMKTLVQAALKYRLVPAVVAASMAVSVADAFAATTSESSSFKFGTFDCTVLSMEVILSNGQYVMARSNDPSTADLIYGSAGALHSLGLTTLFEIALVPAGEYVEVTYSPILSISGATSKMQQVEQGPHMSMPVLSADFVEVIMFDSSSGFLVTGRFTPTASRVSLPRSLDGNSFSRYARSVWQDAKFVDKKRVEILPVVEYLFRHDDRRPCARSSRLLRGQKTSASFIGEARTMVLQEIGLPVEAAEEHIRGFHAARDIWPIWMCPVKPPKTFGRCSFGIGVTFEHLFWSIRFYSSNSVCDGAMKQHLQNAHGFRYLHCRAPCSEETAWIFHDDRWYGKRRSR